MNRHRARPQSASSKLSDMDLAHQNKLLREQVKTLHKEVINAKADCKKATDELNCLMTLIKKSWTGDYTASAHISKIIGAAPPDYTVNPTKMDLDKIDEESIQNGLSKLETRALTNWAVLTIGLLNRSYKEEEQKIRIKQKFYLQNRLHYLEEQEMYARDLRLKHPESHTGLKLHHHKNETIPTIDLLKGRPTSGKKKATVKHLYQYPDPKATCDIKWSDLVIDPIAEKFSEEANYQDSAVNHRQNSLEDDISYDDPFRYAKFGLFDTDKIPRLNYKRPPSGVKQRLSDNLRARPKSAIYASQKGERPLKYETTRPISANKPKPKTFLTDNSNWNHGDLDQCNEESHPSESSGIEGPCNSMEDFDRYLEDRERQNNVDDEQIKINIKKPESLIKFEQETTKMKSMEKDFHKTTLALQKKLGFPSKGLIS